MAKHSPKSKRDFWLYISHEVERAHKSCNGYILQVDLNARLGTEMIPNDKNPINE